jgi:enoyl-[acyl-carrier protein] reductase II
MSRVTELLGCQYPIIQGAMGVICNPELVAAVSEAGAFGLLATAFAQDPEFVRGQVKAAQKLTDAPFGANLFVMNPLAAEFAKILAEEGIKVVTVSGGSPKKLIPVLDDLGIGFIAVVSTVKAAVGAAGAGAAAVVSEGSESGGVQGFGGPSTLVLTPAVVDAVDVPVIAAGGIGDSRGYRAALALGAEGVQVGTRFIATQECAAHRFYKQTIVDSSDVNTGLVNMGRFQVRALRTPLVERLVGGGTPAPDLFTTQAMEESWLGGDAEAGLLPAGQVVGLITGVPTVRDVIEEMVS